MSIVQITSWLLSRGNGLGLDKSDYSTKNQLNVYIMTLPILENVLSCFLWVSLWLCCYYLFPLPLLRYLFLLISILLSWFSTLCQLQFLHSHAMVIIFCCLYWKFLLLLISIFTAMASNLSCLSLSLFYLFPLILASVCH